MSAESVVLISGQSADVVSAAVDPDTGTWRELSRSPAGVNPTFMAVSADGRWIYCLNETHKSGSIVALAWSASTSALTRINAATSGGQGPCHVSIHPSGRWLFAAHYGSGHVAVLPLDQVTGAVGEPSTSVYAGSKAHMAVCDRDGRFLFVPCLGSDYIAVFMINQRLGTLTPCASPHVAVPTGSGPRHLAFAPDQSRAVVINELASTITVFTYTATTAAFTAPVTTSLLPAGCIGKNSAAHVLIAADGKHLYASNRGHNSIVVATLVDAAQPPVITDFASGNGAVVYPRHFAIDPSGTLMVVASQGAHQVSLFRIATDGGLQLIGNHAVGVKPTCVAFIPRR